MQELSVNIPCVLDIYSTMTYQDTCLLKGITQHENSSQLCTKLSHPCIHIQCTMIQSNLNIFPEMANHPSVNENMLPTPGPMYYRYTPLYKFHILPAQCSQTKTRVAGDKSLEHDNYEC